MLMESTIILSLRFAKKVNCCCKKQRTIVHIENFEKAGIYVSVYISWLKRYLKQLGESLTREESFGSSEYISRSRWINCLNSPKGKTIDISRSIRA